MNEHEVPGDAGYNYRTLKNGKSKFVPLLTPEEIDPIIAEYRSDCANMGLSYSEETEFEIVAKAQLAKVLQKIKDGELDIAHLDDV